MHITILSLIVATVLCVFLLLAFWVFTKTPLAPQIEADERRRARRHDRSSPGPHKS
jgi:hypothetical protein